MALVCHAISDGPVKAGLSCQSTSSEMDVLQDMIDRSPAPGSLQHFVEIVLEPLVLYVPPAAMTAIIRQRPPQQAYLSALLSPLLLLLQANSPVPSRNKPCPQLGFKRAMLPQAALFIVHTVVMISAPSSPSEGTLHPEPKVTLLITTMVTGHIRGHAQGTA